LYGEERFLLDDNGPDTNERVLIFVTDTGLSLLASSNTWFIDGNFGLAPEYFKQLYVFRVQKNSIFITAVYCILERKTQYTSEHLFRTVINECEKRGKYPFPFSEIGKSPKLGPKYRGPFKILEKINDLNYKVELILDNKVTEDNIIHVRRLKLYHSRDNIDN